MTMWRSIRRMQNNGCHRREELSRKTAEGNWHCDFVDLNGCYGDGDTLDACIDDAIDSERAWIMARLSEEEDLPKVTQPDEVTLRPGEEVRNIGAIIKLMDGWEE